MKKIDLNLDSYLDMSTKDLEKINMHVKNILQLRENDILEAIKNLDKDALEKAFEFNLDKKLKPKALEMLSNVFYNKLSIEKTAFYEYVINLPDVKNDAQLVNTLTDRMLTKAIQDTEFLDYVLTRDELKKHFHKVQRYLDSQNSIEKLFQFGVIDLKSEPHFFDKAMKENLGAYLEYGENKGLLHVDENKVRDYYKEHFSYVAKPMSKYLKQFGTGNEHLSVGQLMLMEKNDPESNIIQEGNEILKQGFKNIIKGETYCFEFLIQNQKMDTVCINHTVVNFNNLFHSSDNKNAFIEKLSILANEIYQNYPEFIEYFETSINEMNQPKSKAAANMILEKKRLETAITEKDNNKKVKI
jgi:hypothetical protein